VEFILVKGDVVMKKILTALIMVCLMLPLVTLPVFGGAPTDVGGSFGYTFYSTGDAKIGGRNLFFPSGDDETWIGDLDGTAGTLYTLILHGTDPYSDPGQFVSKGTFVGSVQGSDEGTAAFQLTGHQKAGVLWYGTWSIGRGTEGLKGVHGQGTWWFDPGAAQDPDPGPDDPPMFFTYEGQVHWVP
jgi:hypothetical protein